MIHQVRAVPPPIRDRRDAYINDKDPLKNLYLLPSSPETPLSCNVWGQLRALSYWPHNCVRLGKSSSLAWATQFKDIISANEGFVLQWSVPEQALQILARLHVRDLRTAKLLYSTDFRDVRMRFNRRVTNSLPCYLEFPLATNPMSRCSVALYQPTRRCTIHQSSPLCNQARIRLRHWAASPGKEALRNMRTTLFNPLYLHPHKLRPALHCL